MMRMSDSEAGDKEMDSSSSVSEDVKGKFCSMVFERPSVTCNNITKSVDGDSLPSKLPLTSVTELTPSPDKISSHTKLYESKGQWSFECDELQDHAAYDFGRWLPDKHEDFSFCDASPSSSNVDKQSLSDFETSRKPKIPLYPNPEMIFNSLNKESDVSTSQTPVNSSAPVNSSDIETTDSQNSMTSDNNQVLDKNFNKLNFVTELSYSWQTASELASTLELTDSKHISFPNAAVVESDVDEKTQATREDDRDQLENPSKDIEWGSKDIEWGSVLSLLQSDDVDATDWNFVDNIKQLSDKNGEINNNSDSVECHSKIPDCCRDSSTHTSCDNVQPSSTSPGSTVSHSPSLTEAANHNNVPNTCTILITDPDSYITHTKDNNSNTLLHPKLQYIASTHNLTRHSTGVGGGKHSLQEEASKTGVGCTAVLPRKSLKRHWQTASLNSNGMKHMKSSIKTPCFNLRQNVVKSLSVSKASPATKPLIPFYFGSTPGSVSLPPANKCNPDGLNIPSVNSFDVQNCLYSLKSTPNGQLSLQYHCDDPYMQKHNYQPIAAKVSDVQDMIFVMNQTQPVGNDSEVKDCIPITIHNRSYMCTKQALANRTVRDLLETASLLPGGESDSEGSDMDVTGTSDDKELVSSRNSSSDMDDAGSLNSVQDSSVKSPTEREASSCSEPQSVDAADNTRTVSDHTRTMSVHTRTMSDHTRTVSDHTWTVSDHTRTMSDHTRTMSDHTRTVSDHTRTVSDHTRTVSDHTRTVSDHTRTVSDHTDSGCEGKLSVRESLKGSQTFKINDGVKSVELKSVDTAVSEGIQYVHSVPSSLSVNPVNTDTCEETHPEHSPVQESCSFDKETDDVRESCDGNMLSVEEEEDSGGKTDICVSKSESLEHHQSGPESLEHHQSGQESLEHHQSGPESLEHHQSGPESLEHHQSGPESLEHHQKGASDGWNMKALTQIFHQDNSLLENTVTQQVEKECLSEASIQIMNIQVSKSCDEENSLRSADEYLESEDSGQSILADDLVHLESEDSGQSILADDIVHLESEDSGQSILADDLVHLETGCLGDASVQIINQQVGESYDEVNSLHNADDLVHLENEDSGQSIFQDNSETKLCGTLINVSMLNGLLQSGESIYIDEAISGNVIFSSALPLDLSVAQSASLQNETDMEDQCADGSSKNSSSDFIYQQVDNLWELDSNSSSGVYPDSCSPFLDGLNCDGLSMNTHSPDDPFPYLTSLTHDVSLGGSDNSTQLLSLIQQNSPDVVSVSVTNSCLTTMGSSSVKPPAERAVPVDLEINHNCDSVTYGQLNDVVNLNHPDYLSSQSSHRLVKPASNDVNQKIEPIQPPPQIFQYPSLESLQEMCLERSQRRLFSTVTDVNCSEASQSFQVAPRRLMYQCSESDAKMVRTVRRVKHSREEKMKPLYHLVSELRIGNYKFSCAGVEGDRTSRIKIVFSRRMLVYELQVNEASQLSDCIKLSTIEIPFESIAHFWGHDKHLVFELSESPLMFMGKRVCDSNRPGQHYSHMAAYDRSKAVDLTGGYLAIAPYHFVTLRGSSVEKVKQGFAEFSDKFCEMLLRPLIVNPHKQINKPAQMDRQTDRQTHKQTDRQTHKQTDRQTHKQTDRKTHKQIERQTNKQTHKQSHRQTDRQTHKQTDRQTHKQTHKQTHRQTHRQRDRPHCLIQPQNNGHRPVEGDSNKDRLMQTDRGCGCASGCRTKMCRCRKQAVLCSVDCYCCNCENPLNILNKLGLPVELVSLDACLMHNIYQMTPLDQELKREIVLKCCDVVVTLKECIPGLVFCPNKPRCKATYKFSWCKDVLCNENNKEKRNHCNVCQKCVQPMNQHCQCCNKCYYEVADAVKCPVCKNSTDKSKLKICLEHSKSPDK